MKKQAIGIDVSKDNLDYFINKQVFGQFPNTVEAIEQFLAQYDIQQHALVVEPTGTYSNKLIVLATQLGFDVYLVDPKQSHYYSRMIGAYNKTDKIAAQLLCQLAEQVELPLYQPESTDMKARKQLQSVLSSLQKQAASLRSQCHALDQYLYKHDAAKQALENTLKTVENQIESLEQQLSELDDDEAAEFKRLATSVTGIGPKTAQALLIYTNGFRQFERSSQVVKYIGIAPALHQSGSSVRSKARITKNGPSILRAKLFMAANAARRFNNACKILFNRLRKKGKPFKVAMVAVMRKLIRQCFAVVRTQKPFDNELFLSTQH